jgi:hypothetical protein
MTTPATWPPPPDLESIKELVRNADTEDFIVNGSPADEYDGEAKDLHAGIAIFTTADLIVPNILPRIEAIWHKSFAYDDDARATNRQKLEGLAQQIARFFGPEAQPQTRGQA